MRCTPIVQPAAEICRLHRFSKRLGRSSVRRTLDVYGLTCAMAVWSPVASAGVRSSVGGAPALQAESSKRCAKRHLPRPPTTEVGLLSARRRPLVAGVIGETRLSYDLLGRDGQPRQPQTRCVPGMVQTTESVYLTARGRFDRLRRIDQTGRTGGPCLQAGRSCVLTRRRQCDGCQASN